MKAYPWIRGLNIDYLNIRKQGVFEGNVEYAGDYTFTGNAIFTGNVLHSGDVEHTGTVTYSGGAIQIGSGLFISNVAGQAYYGTTKDSSNSAIKVSGCLIDQTYVSDNDYQTPLGITRRVSNRSISVPAADVNTGTDNIEYTGQQFSDGDPVRYVAGSSPITAVIGAVPGTPLTNHGRYYVVNSTADTFQIEESPGGGALDLDGQGAGTHQFIGGERAGAGGGFYVNLVDDEGYEETAGTVTLDYESAEHNATNTSFNVRLNDNLLSTNRVVLKARGDGVVEHYAGLSKGMLIDGLSVDANTCTQLLAIRKRTSDPGHGADGLGAFWTASIEDAAGDDVDALWHEWSWNDAAGHSSCYQVSIASSGTPAARLMVDDKCVHLGDIGTNYLEIATNGRMAKIDPAIGVSTPMLVVSKTVAFDDPSITFDLPDQAVIWRIDVLVVTAFDDSGTDLLDIGITGDVERYLADGDVSATGWMDGMTALGSPDKMSGTTTIEITYTGENADATQGKAEVYIHYTRH